MIASPLTAALVRAAKLAFLELDQAEAELDESDGRLIERVVIGAAPMFRSVLLSKALTDCWKRGPAFQVQVADGSYGEMLNGLREGGIDLILGELRYPEPDAELVQERLIYDRLAMLSGSHHPLAGEPNVSSEALRTFGWVAPPQGAPSRERFEALFGGEHLPAIFVETDSIHLMLDILGNSDFLGCISNIQAQVEIPRGAVCEIDADTARTGWPVGLTYRKKWSPTNSQDSLLMWLREGAFEQYEEESQRNLKAKA